MTDVMLLDLSSDDGLLVPFRSHPAPLQSESKPFTNSTKNKKKNTTNNCHDANHSSRGLGRFFSRPRIPQETPTPQENVPLKVTTFAFPKARVEQADEFLLPESSKDKEPQDDSDDNNGDNEEPSEEESEKQGGKRKTSSSTASKPAESAAAAAPQKSLRRVDEWDPHENPWYEEKEESRSWRVEGYGNTPMPQNDDSSKGLGGLFRGWRGGGGGRRRNADDDLRSMKVATEDTKDDKTMLEHIGKAALVVLIPELYADEEDGEGNLGMYRSINVDDDDGGGEKGLLKKEPDELSMLRTEVNQLRLKVLRLEKELKSSELEAGSWKLRCTEVEKELRRYKHQNDDDSSVDALESGESDQADVDDNDDDDDGIDEDWTEFSGVKEGNLLDMNKVEGKGESECISVSDRPEEVPNLLDAETTVDTPVAADEEPDLMDLQDHKMVFDPLATK